MTAALVNDPVATSSPGRHARVPADEQYGKHSRTNASGPWATDLIARQIRAGEAYRLVWRGEERDQYPEWRVEFPTAELPVIRTGDTDKLDW